MVDRELDQYPKIMEQLRTLLVTTNGKRRLVMTAEAGLGIHQVLSDLTQRSNAILIAPRVISDLFARRGDFTGIVTFTPHYIAKYPGPVGGSPDQLVVVMYPPWRHPGSAYQGLVKGLEGHRNLIWYTKENLHPAMDHKILLGHNDSEWRLS